jgi:NADH-quinone oxidoreductase subunit M
VLAGFGILVGVAYTLRVLQKSFFGEPVPDAEHAPHPLPPISIPERIGAVILLAATVVVGLFPNLLLTMIDDGFKTHLFDAVLRNGGAS